MNNRWFSILLIAAGVFLLSNCGGGGSGGVGASAVPADMAAYNAGVTAYNAQSYATAAATFQSLLANFPNSSLVGHAHYYLGKSRYHLGDYAGAIAEFDFVLQNYPASPLIDNSLLWKGKSQQGLAKIDFAAGNPVAVQEFADARATYQLMINQFPASSLIPSCRYQIGLTYYDEARYADAIPVFQTVAANYPAAGAADGALYYLARSIHRLALAAVPGYTLAQARNEYAGFLRSYPASPFADNAQFQIGKTYYDELNYVAAIAEFNKVFANYVAPTAADEAKYYLAGSIHELAKAATPGYTLAQARTEYASLLTSYPASSFADNAQFQIGKTYYDELNYVAAIAEFNKVFANYAAPTAGDETQLYLAGSIHELARTATPGYTYGQARTEYARLLTAYPASPYADNAQYRIGRTYYDELNFVAAIAEFNKVFANYAVPTAGDETQFYLGSSIHELARTATPGYTYAQARTAYGLVATNYPASIFVDRAAYNSALTYHDSNQCTLELAALQAFVAAYPLSAFLAVAQAHIADLTLAPPATHTICI